MRKVFVLCVAVCLIAGITACKKEGGEAAPDAAKPAESAPAADYSTLGKYAEVGPVMDKMIKLLEDLVAGMDKAATADEVAASMNAYSDKVAEILPKMNEIGDKFPEFKTQDQPPAELKPYNDRLMAMMGKLYSATSKADQFASDPKVAAAREKYDKVMAEMK